MFKNVIFVCLLALVVGCEDKKCETSDLSSTSVVSSSGQGGAGGVDAVAGSGGTGGAESVASSGGSPGVGGSTSTAGGDPGTGGDAAGGAGGK